MGGRSTKSVLNALCKNGYVWEKRLIHNTIPI